MGTKTTSRHYSTDAFWDAVDNRRSSAPPVDVAQDPRYAIAVPAAEIKQFETRLVNLLNTNYQDGDALHVFQSGMNIVFWLVAVTSETGR